LVLVEVDWDDLEFLLSRDVHTSVRDLENCEYEHLVANHSHISSVDSLLVARVSLKELEYQLGFDTLHTLECILR
jgi:hypothetical protein